MKVNLYFFIVRKKEKRSVLVFLNQRPYLIEISQRANNCFAEINEMVFLSFNSSAFFFSKWKGINFRILLLIIKILTIVLQSCRTCSICEESIQTILGDISSLGRLGLSAGPFFTSEKFLFFFLWKAQVKVSHAKFYFTDKKKHLLSLIENFKLT